MLVWLRPAADAVLEATPRTRRALRLHEGGVGLHAAMALLACLCVTKAPQKARLQALPAPSHAQGRPVKSIGLRCLLLDRALTSCSCSCQVVKNDVVTTQALLLLCVLPALSEGGFLQLFMSELQCVAQPVQTSAARPCLRMMPHLAPWAISPATAPRPCLGGLCTMAGVWCPGWASCICIAYRLWRTPVHCTHTQEHVFGPPPPNPRQSQLPTN